MYLNLFIPFESRFALTDSGSMYELCPYTGLANPIDSPEKVLDYIITATNDDGIEILALTEDESKSTFLKVFDYSSEFIRSIYL